IPLSNHSALTYRVVALRDFGEKPTMKPNYMSRKKVAVLLGPPELPKRLQNALRFIYTRVTLPSLWPSEIPDLQRNRTDLYSGRFGRPQKDSR
ncbi:hypothetical protein ACTXT7_003541, partial [Hymenolepis weldensis]